MRDIVICADLHTREYNNNTRDFFEFISKCYSEKCEKPILFILGDICDGVSNKLAKKYPENKNEVMSIFKKQQELAKEGIDILQKQGFKIIAIPGNHEYPINGYYHDCNLINIGDDFLKSINERDIKYPRVEEYENYVFICLNSFSCVDYDDEPKSIFTKLKSDGFLGEYQISSLIDIISKYNGKNILIMLHHSPLHVLPHLSLRDSELFISSIKFANVENGKPKNSILIFHGHYHSGPSLYVGLEEYGIDGILELKNSIPQNFYLVNSISDLASSFVSRGDCFNFIEIKNNTIQYITGYLDQYSYPIIVQNKGIKKKPTWNKILLKNIISGFC